MNPIANLSTPLPHGVFLSPSEGGVKAYKSSTLSLVESPPLKTVAIEDHEEIEPSFLQPSLFTIGTIDDSHHGQKG